MDLNNRKMRLSSYITIDIDIEVESSVASYYRTGWAPSFESTTQGDILYSSQTHEEMATYFLLSALILTYDRIQLLLKNIVVFSGIEHLMESVIIVWNHQVLKPESFQWPKLKFPIHVSVL